MNQYIKSSGFITTHPIGKSTYKLSGASTAANETGFEVVGMGGVTLDAGISTHGTDYVFITHAHHDHIKNITSTILNCESDKKRSNVLKIYCPRGSYDFIKKKIESDYFATKHNKQPSSLPWILIGISPNDTIEIHTAGKKYIVTAIQCTHSIACTGYSFTEVRNKVTAEHIENIVTMTREQKLSYFETMESQGVDCYEKQLIPLFVYLGDTTHKVFDFEGDKIFNFPTIIVECTFLNPDEVKKAKDDKHMHWTNLKPIISAHIDTQFILYHFSARYKHEEIKDFFDIENMPNVVPFVNYGISISDLCKKIHDALCSCDDLVKCKIHKVITEQQNIAKGTHQVSRSDSASISSDNEFKSIHSSSSTSVKSSGNVSPIILSGNVSPVILSGKTSPVKNRPYTPGISRSISPKSESRRGVSSSVSPKNEGHPGFIRPSWAVYTSSPLSNGSASPSIKTTSSPNGSTTNLIEKFLDDL